jgi:hypothetical protein
MNMMTKGVRMAEKTIVEKAGETVGFGMAMASDVAGTIKTAFDTAVTTVTEVLKKAPAKKAATKVAKKSATKKAPAKKVAKKAAVKAPAKKAAKKAPAKKVAKKSAKKAVKTR